MGDAAGGILPVPMGATGEGRPVWTRYDQSLSLFASSDSGFGSSISSFPPDLLFLQHALTFCHAKYSNSNSTSQAKMIPKIIKRGPMSPQRLRSRRPRGLGLKMPEVDGVDGVDRGLTVTVQGQFVIVSVWPGVVAV